MEAAAGLQSHYSIISLGCPNAISSHSTYAVTGTPSGHTAVFNSIYSSAEECDQLQVG